MFCILFIKGLNGGPRRISPASLHPIKTRARLGIALRQECTFFDVKNCNGRSSSLSYLVRMGLEPSTRGEGFLAVAVAVCCRRPWPRTGTEIDLHTQPLLRCTCHTSRFGSVLFSSSSLIQRPAAIRPLSVSRSTPS
ncbi:hypothetical protein LZ554_003628 [Drepanopeziza brunnea f. sp. 'monogermtubi']|nr:hypothetical protein LZ554_003628 [Drepanopeziza brunnea f. sp. 'monogermtubi']